MELTHLGSEAFIWNMLRLLQIIRDLNGYKDSEIRSIYGPYKRNKFYFNYLINYFKSK